MDVNVERTEKKMGMIRKKLMYEVRIKVRLEHDEYSALEKMDPPNEQPLFGFEDFENQIGVGDTKPLIFQPRLGQFLGKKAPGEAEFYAKHFDLAATSGFEQHVLEGLKALKNTLEAYAASGSGSDSFKI